MEFSAGLPNFGLQPNDFLSCVEEVESSLDYSNLFVADERLYRNPYSLLSTAADRTDQIGLGTGVTNPYTRHPAITAAAIATLDELSQGRAILGLGAGSPIGLDPLGYEHQNPVETVRDAVRSIRRLHQGETVSMSRAEFEFDDAALDILPESHVPIYVAGRGPHLLRLGGYRGDGVIAGAGVASPEGMEYAFEQIEIGADKANRDIDDIDVICWAWLSIAEDRSTAVDGVAWLAASVLNKTPLNALTAIGVDSEVAKQVKDIDNIDDRSDAELREYLPKEVIEQFAIAGTPAECLDHVKRLKEVGVDHIGTLAFDNREHDRLSCLRRFSKHVISELSD